ncbi:MAG: phosphotransferase family protein [Fimbriimonas sp.]
MSKREEQTIAALAAWQPGIQVVELTKMPGGMSATMLRAKCQLPTGELREVVARFPGAYIRELFEDAGAHEFRVLEAVFRAGLPVPRPLWLGEAHDGHFLLLEFLPGRATANPANPTEFIREMAATLAHIHQTDLSSGQLDFLPQTRSRYISSREELNKDFREPEIVATLEEAGEQPVSRSVLRHGDFWPGNILWQDDKITGIIDWENALLGPAIADLAISRLDVLWILGVEAMEEFTARYLELNSINTATLPYWDLRTSLRPLPNLEEWAGPYESLGRPDVTTAHIEACLLAFIESALAKM